MTRRERLENKQQKREEWAGKADTRATARLETANKAVEQIPFGQPILVGHHSEKGHRNAIKRCDNNMRKGVEESNLADHHRTKAAGIDKMLDKTIFSGDVDAIEQLENRIAEREKERANAKAVNAAWRKAKGDAKKFAELAGVSEMTANRIVEEMKKGYGNKPFPSYVSANLSGNISADKKRLVRIKRMLADKQVAAENGGFSWELGDNGYLTIVFAVRPDYSLIKELKANDFWFRSHYWCIKAESDYSKLYSSIAACHPDAKQTLAD